MLDASPPCSLNAAATAAVATLEAWALTLLRRFIRWAGLEAARDTEWEWVRDEEACRGRLPETGRGSFGVCQLSPFLVLRAGKVLTFELAMFA